MRYVVVVLACLTCGCSALHWGGDTAGKRPGFVIRGGDFWGPAQLEATSDMEAKADELSFESSDPKTGHSTSRFLLRGLTFGQSASTVVREEPAKLDAIARVQLTQVEYVKAMTEGIRGIVHEFMPALSILASAQLPMETFRSVTASLPGGLTLGGQKVESPQDLQKAAQHALDIVRRIDSSLPSPATPTSQPAEE